MPATYWIFVTLTSLFLIFLSYSTFATSRLLRHWQPDRNLLLMPAENGLRIVMIFVTLALGKFSGLPPEMLGWDLSRLWQQVLLGLGCGLALAFFFYWATRWVLRSGRERLYSNVIIEAITPQHQQELILVLLAMLPVVLLEELLFRSLLIGGFQLIIPASLLVVGWGIFFGILHSPQGVWGMVGAGMAGMLLGMLFLVTDSLVAPLVAHYMTNAVQIIQAMRLGLGKKRVGNSTEGA